MKHQKWILIAALALGAPAVMPLPAFAADKPRLEVVDMSDVPRPARRALRDAENGGRLIKLVRIDYGGHTSYRASFEDHGQVHVIRVNEEGKVINERDRDRYGAFNDQWIDQEKRQEVRFSEIPDAVRRTLRREMSDRKVDQVTEVRRGDFTYYVVESADGRRLRVDRFGDVLAEGDPMLLSDREDHKGRYWEERAIDRDLDQLASGQPMRYNDLPGEVKNAIGGQMHQGDRATDTVHLHNGDYLVTLESGDGRFERLYRVSSSGRIVSVRNTTDEGAVPVRFNDLPGPVKETLSHEGGRNDIRRIMQVTREGHTWYNVLVNDGDHMRLIRMDTQGHRLD